MIWGARVDSEIGQRLCDTFMKDRVFIAGDACHTHSPKVSIPRTWIATRPLSIDLDPRFVGRYVLMYIMKVWRYEADEPGVC